MLIHQSVISLQQLRKKRIKFIIFDKVKKFHPNIVINKNITEDLISTQIYDNILILNFFQIFNVFLCVIHVIQKNFKKIS